jgi:hypothetical protein
MLSDSPPSRLRASDRPAAALGLVKDRLQGEMLADLKGQRFTAKVDVGRDKAK